MREGTRVRRSWMGRGLVLAVAVPLMAAMLAACGNPSGSTGSAPGTTSSSGSSSSSSSSGSSASSSASSGATTSGGTYTVDKCSTSLGSILCNSQGRTLYMYTADTPNHSGCTWAGCSALWPYLTASGTPTLQPGIPGKLGTITTAGTTQVTYNGMPLYTYAVDTKAGEVLGQKVKDPHGIWYVISSTGKVIK